MTGVQTCALPIYHIPGNKKQNASSAGSIAGFFELFGLLFFLAQIIGLVLFARQLSAEGSAGAAFANLSALLGIVLMAVIAMSTDLGLSALALGDKGLTAEAMALAQVSLGSGASFGILFSLANGLVTIPMIGQASTSTKKYLGFAFALLMILLLIIELFGISLGEIVEIIIWLGASLVFVAVGDISTKSNPTSCALERASDTGTTPICSLFSPINRT